MYNIANHRTCIHCGDWVEIAPHGPRHITGPNNGYYSHIATVGINSMAEVR